MAIGGRKGKNMGRQRDEDEVKVNWKLLKKAQTQWTQSPTSTPPTCVNDRR
jgi:hypothetical protein